MTRILTPRVSALTEPVPARLHNCMTASHLEGQAGGQAGVQCVILPACLPACPPYPLQGCRLYY